MAVPNPIEILKANRAQIVGKAQTIGKKRLLQLLGAAQTNLNNRLRRAEGLGGPGVDSFTAHQLRVTVLQIDQVLRVLKGGLKKLALDNADDLTDPAVEGVIEYMKAAEKKFAGITERLPLKDALLFERAQSGVESSMLRRLEGDPKKGPGILDRYGDAVVQQFEGRLQQRLIARQPWADVRDALITDSPFLQQAPAHWAERIIRTEAMNGSNRAIWETNKEAENQLGDVVKFLSATFDNRTAADSYAVHGQCRRPTEPFNTWQGAVQHPPARPNDREIVVTHRLSWPIPAELKPRSAAEVQARWIAEGRKGAHPPIPKITTVPFGEFGKVQAPPPKPPIEEPPAIPPKPARAAIASPFFDENVKPFKRPIQEPPAIPIKPPRAAIASPFFDENITPFVPTPPYKRPEPPPPPPPPPKPVEPVNVMAKKVGEQKGSNEGGFYRGSDDVLRYVKFYKDPIQGQLEHLANKIYGDLGLPAVKSDAFTTPDGRHAYSSEVIKGDTLAKKGLDQKNAKQVLKGFAADVLVKNWDAVGLDHDNVIIGKGGKAMRIDNGGAFLHRAKAGLKPVESLHKLDEWEQFFNPGKNPAYAKIAQAAGVSKAEDILGIKQQIKAIQKLRDAHGSWGNYVDKVTPNLPKIERDRVVAMLAERTSQLVQKAKVKRPPKPKPGELEFHQLPRKALDGTPPKPRGYDEGEKQYKADVRQKIGAWRKDHADQYDAMRSYTGAGYRPMRDTKWLTEEEWYEKHAGGQRSAYQVKRYEDNKREYERLANGFESARKAIHTERREVQRESSTGSEHEELLTDLYRGIHTVSDAKIREFANKSVYEIEAVASTSWQPETAKCFGYEGSGKDQNAVIFHFKCKPKNGSHKLAVEDASSSPGEGEVLFKHGLKFKVMDAHQMEGRKQTLLLTLEEI